MKIRVKPETWDVNYVTHRGGQSYIWYRANEGKASMILPSGKRPPNGWTGKGADKHPDLIEWESAIEEGDDSKTLLERKGKKAKQARSQLNKKTAPASEEK